MSDESGIKNIARGARDAARTRASLVRRIEALEAEVQEQRQLNRRVAELLIPLQDADKEKAEKILAEYRSRI
jgi:Holliday junction resolvasome RuvABC ATP-dependent DNA helicase subunit